MEWLMRRAGGRKLTGFIACLTVGAVMIYFGRLDAVGAGFICALYGAYVGGNASEHIATAIKGFALARRPQGETDGE
jgi:hypothetical protein|tara:strand:- start:337 stop:567 length:231 start_codon:yes stop_codon:yes gene_type:complete